MPLLCTSAERKALLASFDEGQYTPNNYPHPGLQTTTINFIFKDQYADPLGIESSLPAIQCDEGDVTDTQGAKVRLTKKSGISVTNVDYKVVGSQPKSNGFIILELEKI